MTGTIVNAIAIVAASLVGLLLKRGIPEYIKTAILKVMGLVIVIVGLAGVLTAMISIGDDGRLQTDGFVLLLASLAGGCFIGEILKIEDRLNSLTEKLERKLKADDFSKGFVTASIVFVIGAMGIMGAMNDGLYGDPTVLFTKAMLDGIAALIMATTLGIGVMFSAIPVFAVQGSIAMLARFLAPYLTDEPVRLFSMVGYAIVMAIGLNFLADTKIRLANLLPALAVPILYSSFFLT